MGWSSDPGALPSKLWYAKHLAACMGMILLRQGDAVGLTAFHDRVEGVVGDPLDALLGRSAPADDLAVTREAATRLRVTTKTINAHISNALSKLGYSSRSQYIAALLAYHAA